MNHKQDAIKKVNEVVELHQSNGLNKTDAHRAALVTLEYSLNRHDSIGKRAINYLRSLLFGEEAAVELHQLEQDLSEQYTQIFFNPIEKGELASTIAAEINTKILHIKSQWKDL